MPLQRFSIRQGLKPSRQRGPSPIRRPLVFGLFGWRNSQVNLSRRRIRNGRSATGALRFIHARIIAYTNNA